MFSNTYELIGAPQLQTGHDPLMCAPFNQKLYRAFSQTHTYTYGSFHPHARVYIALFSQLGYVYMGAFVVVGPSHRRHQNDVARAVIVLACYRVRRRPSVFHSLWG